MQLVPEPTEEVMLMAPPPKKERRLSEATKVVIGLGKSFTIAAAIFSAGVVANQRVGAVLIELAEVKKEQAAQRKILEEAVTKEYFAWRMEQASDACFKRAIAMVYEEKIPVLCPQFAIRGRPNICHVIHVEKRE